MSKKTLSVFSLVMINVIAIDSLRSLPLSAEYGTSLIAYYIIAAIAFFLPTAFVSAELASAWPETGGIYVWVREAFGPKLGFMTIWLQWFYNICWYPTIMALVAATIAYVIDPALIHSKTYMLQVILVLFWLATIINCIGMRASSMLSTVGAILGTIIPMGFIIILAGVWLVNGNPTAVHFSWHDIMPDLSNWHNLTLITALLYGLVGMEMSATHAKEVKNPQRDYPIAMFWSTIIILFSMIFGSLAVAIVVPAKSLNIVAGLLQAFSLFFAKFHMSYLMPVLAILIVVGALAGVGAWILSPAKGLMVASQDGSLPAGLSKTSKGGVPTRILLLQGVIFTALCSIFLLMPSVSSSFWVLTDITAILSLIVYVAMFLACIVLRFKYPHVERSFKIPGGNLGLWVFCLLGLASCLFTIVVGFIPPSQLQVGNLLQYEAILIVGVIIGCLAPFVIRAFSHQKARH